MNGSMVVIDVDADEFAKASSSSEFAKVFDKSSGITRETNDGTVDIHHECMRAVYLCASTQVDI